MRKYTSRIYLTLVFAILYIPILTVVLFSFNNTESSASFSGFSFYWYRELFKSEEAWVALRNTLILAALSSLISTVIGTAAAEGIYRMRNKYLKGQRQDSVPARRSIRCGSCLRPVLYQHTFVRASLDRSASNANTSWQQSISC